SCLGSAKTSIQVSVVHRQTTNWDSSVEIAPCSGELRNLLQFTILQRRLMGNYTRDGHVERLRDVHQGRAFLEYGGDEFVHQVTVRAAMAARRNPRRQRRTLYARQTTFQTLILAIERPSLSAHAPHLSTRSRRIPAHGHARSAAFAGPEQRDLGAKCILVRVVHGL